jgi:hypothetical protein
MRGDRKKRETIDPETDQPVEDRVIDIRSFKPKRIPQLMWRECIKKVWEVDLLLCGNCGGKMKIVSFIYERAVIKKILVHLKLDTKPAKQRAPPAPQRDISESVKYVSYDDGWPGYEEPAVDVKLL